MIRKIGTNCQNCNSTATVGFVLPPVEPAWAKASIRPVLLDVLVRGPYGVRGLIRQPRRAVPAAAVRITPPGPAARRYEIAPPRARGMRLSGPPRSPLSPRAPAASRD